jgi:hypothetical protein
MANDNGVVQFLDSQALLPGSVGVGVDRGRYGNKVIEFAVPTVLITARDEDLIDLEVNNKVFTILLLRMNFTGDACFIRGLIKGERAVIGG